MRLRCRESPEGPARTGRIERVNVKGGRWCGGGERWLPRLRSDFRGGLRCRHNASIFDGFG